MCVGMCAQMPVHLFACLTHICQRYDQESHFCDDDGHHRFSNRPSHPVEDTDEDNEKDKEPEKTRRSKSLLSNNEHRVLLIHPEMQNTV